MKSHHDKSVLAKKLELPCGATIKNRIGKSAMSEIMGDKNHQPTSALVNLYGRWASGGIGLLITGNAMIDKQALGEPRNVVIDENSDMEMLKSWAESGKKKDTHIWVQLNHPGRQSPSFLSAKPVAPSAIPYRSTLKYAFNTPRELMDEEIRELIRKFGKSAFIVKKAGFTGVQIHGAHGYLVSQFLSPIYNQRFPFISPVTLPRGVIDLARDMPPQDVPLVAPTGTLVARDGTHPALIQLFVQAAQQVHGSAGWFHRKGEFPNARNTERPLAAEAERFYRNGVPFLQRYLPFWLANLFERMWPVLVTIIAVLLPLSRMLPPLYEFRVRSRIFRWYGQLRALEAAVNKRPASELTRELEALERRVEQIAVPLAYTDELYALRSHIQQVLRRVQATIPPVAQ